MGVNPNEDRLMEETHRALRARKAEDDRAALAHPAVRREIERLEETIVSMDDEARAMGKDIAGVFARLREAERVRNEALALLGSISESLLPAVMVLRAEGYPMDAAALDEAASGIERLLGSTPPPAHDDEPSRPSPG